MMSELDKHTKADTAGKGQPRFGSYLGLFFVAAILGILSLRPSTIPAWATRLINSTRA